MPRERVLPTERRKNMRYMPPKIKRSGVWSFLPMLAGISLYVSSAFVPKYVSVVQAVSFAFFAFSIYIITRYVLTSYYYEIDGENFRIVKITGKKNEPMCNISLRTKGEVKSPKDKRKPTRIRYDYTRNFMPNDKYIYCFIWNGRDAEIVFEPSADFVAFMNARIKELENAPEQEQKTKTNGWYEE